MSAGDIGGGRVVTFCPLCQQADDHPKHAISGQDPHVARHLDCCRQAGCPDGSCDVVLSVIGHDTQTGQAMLDLITGADTAALNAALAARAPDVAHFSAADAGVTPTPLTVPAPTPASGGAA